MPPTSDGIKTVGCSLTKLIPDPNILHTLQDAVSRTNTSTRLVTELLNLHIRKILVNEHIDMSIFLNPNWLLTVYNAVTKSNRKIKLDDALQDTINTYMPSFDRVDRSGIQQCLLYDARNLATVASTNIWMHFKKRVMSYVRTSLAVPQDEYALLTTDQRRQLKLDFMHIASDICKPADVPFKSQTKWHEWVINQRNIIRIDNVIGDWNNKPLEYHLKERPHIFFYPLLVMSTYVEEHGGKAFSLFPLRRTLIPRHIRFDQKALRDLLKMGRSDYIKERTKQAKLEGNVSSKRRTKDEMIEENRELFGRIINLKAANVARSHMFDFAFTTDGVCARLQMRKRITNAVPNTHTPRRGIWAIDELKRTTRLEQLHVIGVDPGKRELVVCIDTDNPKDTALIRYTQKQRLRDIRSRQYANEGLREKPSLVTLTEQLLTGCNSRTANITNFATYISKRHEHLDIAYEFYSRIEHRKRRWKTVIKTQQSEERLFKKLEQLQTDDRQLVLAYGSWGLVAGRPNVACNKGNPPCIGVGLMRKLSRRFLVVPTPEAYTSKLCCKCLNTCEPWQEKELFHGKKIRGLRRCTQRDCMLPLNRDRNGATNIGTNFKRLMINQPTIRQLSTQELAFHDATICLECE